MKMRKTIAAISAAAVAVSAMAMNASAITLTQEGSTTTDAAFEGKTLHFNLAHVIHGVSKENGYATYTMKVTRVAMSTGTSTGAIFALVDQGSSLNFDNIPSYGSNPEIVWTVNYYEDNNSSSQKTAIYSTVPGDDNYDKNNRVEVFRTIAGTNKVGRTYQSAVAGHQATTLFVPAETWIATNEIYASVKIPHKLTKDAFVSTDSYKATDITAFGLNGTKAAPVLADIVVNTPDADEIEVLNRAWNLGPIDAANLIAAADLRTQDAGLTVDVDSLDKTIVTGDSEDRVYPMKSTISGTTDYAIGGGLAAADLISYLSNAPLVPQDATWKDYVSYQQPAAAINDALANYDKVTVKFNTAVKNISTDSHGAYYNDGGSAEYKNFEQHLYWNDAQYDNSYYQNDYQDINGYTSYNYFNLFSGALIVNQGITMSLSDVNYFSYGQNFIAFEWDKVMTSNANSQVSYYAQYVQNLQLRTSTPWYWDSVDFVLENTVAENVDTTAGAEEETDTIEEDEDDSEIVADEVEVEVDEVEVDEVETEVVVVEETPVENAKTGNASVALAVIPVALAAAAVVAKKRS